MERNPREDRLAERRHRLSIRASSQGTHEPGSKLPVAEFALEDRSREDPASKNKAVQAVARSAKGVDDFVVRSRSTVASSRLGALQAEQQRQAREGEAGAVQLRQVQAEASASSRAVAVIQMRWPDILQKYQLPQDLAAAISRQAAACDAVVLGSKARVIGELRSAIQGKEGEQADALRCARARVDALLAHMGRAHVEMGALLQRELDAVGAAMQGDRAEVASLNRRELTALFDARRAAEKRLVELALSREELEAREMSELHTADVENLTRLKVKLESDVAILEQQLEKMKFTYALNTEKLEYNYRVLTERDSENKAGLAVQKSRLGRLRATLARLQGQFATVDAAYEARNASIRTDFVHVTRAHADLSGKLAAFAAADSALTADLVALHGEELRVTAARLAAADRIIAEQVLMEPAAAALVGEGAGGPGAAAGPLVATHAPRATAPSGPAAEGAWGDAGPASRSTGRRGDAQTPPREQAATRAAAPSPLSLPSSAGRVADPLRGAAAAAEAAPPVAPDGAQARLHSLLRAIGQECGPVLWSTDAAASVAALEATDTEAAFELGAAHTLRALGCGSPLELLPLLAFCEAEGVDRFLGAAPVSPASATTATTAPPGSSHARGVAPGGGRRAWSGSPSSSLGGATLARVLQHWLEARRAPAPSTGSSTGLDASGAREGGSLAAAAAAHRALRRGSRSLPTVDAAGAAASAGSRAAEGPATAGAVRRGSRVAAEIGALPPGARRTGAGAGNGPPSPGAPSPGASPTATALTPSPTTGSLHTPVPAAAGAAGAGFSVSQHCVSNDAVVGAALREWRALPHTVPPVRVRVWRALEEELGRFKAVVEQRRALLDAVDSLRARNQRMKTLLAGFLYQERSGRTALRVPASAALSIPPELHDELRALAASGAAQAVKDVIAAAGVEAAPWLEEDGGRGSAGAAAAGGVGTTTTTPVGGSRSVKLAAAAKSAVAGPQFRTGGGTSALLPQPTEHGRDDGDFPATAPMSVGTTRRTSTKAGGRGFPAIGAAAGAASSRRGLEVVAASSTLHAQ